MKGRKYGPENGQVYSYPFNEDYLEAEFQALEQFFECAQYAQRNLVIKSSLTEGGI